LKTLFINKEDFMKTNFKKLALTAGVSAALAAGSMSAHAVITSLPAPAQLIPFFYFNDVNSMDTVVRIIVPKSVGVDTVINLLAGYTGPGTGIPPTPNWFDLGAGLKPNTNLGPNIAPAKNNALHYWVMDKWSSEVVNRNLPVSPDDTEFLIASDILPSTYSAIPLYLIVANDSASLGGAPTFQFAADAWLENPDNANGVASAVNIPVLGLADTADATPYPTPTNNLIEAYPVGAGGPIASPIITGIRTSSTEPGLNFRVIDLPMQGNNYANTIIAWADRNAPSLIDVNSNDLKNGLSGKLYGVDCEEVETSLGTFSLPYQLNVVEVIPEKGGRVYNPLGVYDGYGSGPSATSAGMKGIPTLEAGGSVGWGKDGKSGYCAPGRSWSVGAQVARAVPGDGGFLKMVIDAVPLPAPAAALQKGAYSSIFAFVVPAKVNAPVKPSTNAVDTGFYNK